MKVALILCPVLFKRCPLIGLGYLSGYLKSKGYDVDIFDLNTMVEIQDEGREDRWNDKLFVEKYILGNTGLLEALADKVLESNAEIFGFSIWRSTKYLSLAIARMIKQKDKSKLIVFGGPECSFSGRELIADESVDMLVIGEGEETFFEIAQAYKKDKKAGLCRGALIKNNGEIIDCGFRPEIDNLDSIPFSDFSGFSLDRYYLPETLPITFYRGCSRRCVFCNCSVIWKKYRSRSAGNIYSEMENKKRAYSNLRRFEVDDTALNLDLKVISQLCDLIISNGLSIDWGGSAIIRPDMDSGLLKKIARAGCKNLAYGLESGSQDVVDRMGKSFKVADAERVIRDTYNAGMQVDLNIVIGFPNETECDFQQTVEFIKRNREFITFVSFPSECWVGNQTYLHMHPEEFGVKLNSGGHSWESQDGMNTHRIREERVRVFCDFVDSLGLSLHNYATIASRK